MNLNLILFLVFGAVVGGGYYVWKMKNAPVYGESGIRLFTQSECDNMDGNYIARSGECLKKAGGSYSWQFRKL